MEYPLLVRVVEELAGVLPGARVDKVVPAEDEEFVLLLRQKGRNHFLLISPERALPRIHLISRKPAAAPSSAPFLLSLRKYLAGSRVKGVRLLNQDRVVELSFARLDKELFLILEILGASSNVLLIDRERKIIAVLRPVPPGERPRRPLVPGIGYEPPAMRQHHADKVPKGGEAPVLSEELAGLAANRTAEAMLDGILAGMELSSFRQSLSTEVRKARLRTSRRSEAVQGDLASAGNAEQYRLMGELILLNLPLIEKGQEQADLRDHEGTVHAVMLDPSRSPAENADRYFRKYKKAKAGLSVLRERQKEAGEELELLTKIADEVNSAPDRVTLDALRRSLVKRGLIRDRAGKAAGPVVPSAPYRSVAFAGWEIIIGRSAAGNDYVTMHLARPDDLWMHAEGMPGSHVLVRNPGKRDIPPDVFRKAASLAAYYSKGRGASKVPVAYTMAKYVAKPKGTAPGMVVLRERKSIVVAPEPE